MPAQTIAVRAVNAILAMSMAIGVSFIDVSPSLACTSCTTDKPQRRAFCNDVVDKKGVKGSARESEFDKCMMDPVNYK